jgi:hypothetical protein
VTRPQRCTPTLWRDRLVSDTDTSTPPTPPASRPVLKSPRESLFSSPPRSSEGSGLNRDGATHSKVGRPCFWPLFLAPVAGPCRWPRILARVAGPLAGKGFIRPGPVVRRQPAFQRQNFPGTISRYREGVGLPLAPPRDSRQSLGCGMFDCPDQGRPGDSLRRCPARCRSDSAFDGASNSAVDRSSGAPPSPPDVQGRHAN